MGILDKVLAWFGAVADWIGQTPSGAALKRIVTRFGDTVNGVPPDVAQSLIDTLTVIPLPTTQIVAQTVAALTGKPSPLLPTQLDATITDLLRDPRAYMLKVADALGRSPQMAEVQQTLGRILVDIVITPLENTLDHGVEDPKQFSAQFHGALASLTLAGHVFSLAAEVTGLGQIETVGRAISDLYFNFGLGFMGWQTISPLLDIGVKEAGGRYYNRRYRPRRWTVSELMSLFALNEITQADLSSEMQSQGYRDQDIALAVRLAQQRISVGDVLEAYSLGEMSADDALSRIRERGFRLDDARFLIQLEDAKRTQSNRDSIVSIARTAYKKQLISADRFRGIMVAAHYTAERIDLELMVGRLEIDGEKRDLTVAQVKEALNNGVLREPEAKTYLLAAGLDQDAVTILLNTWRAEAVPDVVRLNANTVSTAYVEAVLTRGEASDKLLELGWNPGDAEIILRIADARIAERQKRQTVVEQRPLAVSQIESAFKESVITDAKALDLLRGLRLAESDARIVLDTWKAELVTAPRSLSENGIVAAYRVGVLTREEAASRLVAFGLPAESAEILLATADAEIMRSQVVEREVATRAITVPVLRSAYFQDIIDAARLRSELDALKAEPALIGLLVATWDAEKRREPARLSSSAIGAAYAAGLVTRSRASELLTGLGLDAKDADLVLEIVERNFVERHPHPTGEAILKAYANKLLLYDRALEQLKALGYDDAQAGFLLRSYDLRPSLAVKQLSEAVVIKLYRLGQFNSAQAVERLIALGYDDANAELLLLAETSALPKAEKGA